MPRCEICAATWQVTLSMRFFASPAPGRCVQTCVIHKIRSTQRITTPPEEDYKPRPSVACTKKWMKTGHVVACGQTDRPNRQTRLSQYVASRPVRSNNSVSQKLKLLQENILSYYTGVYDFSVNKMQGKPDYSPSGSPSNRLLIIVNLLLNWFACVH